MSGAIAILQAIGMGGPSIWDQPVGKAIATHNLLKPGTTCILDGKNYSASLLTHCDLLVAAWRSKFLSKIYGARIGKICGHEHRRHSDSWAQRERLCSLICAQSSWKALRQMGPSVQHVPEIYAVIVCSNVYVKRFACPFSNES